jgi:hypothetical protein
MKAISAQRRYATSPSLSAYRITSITDINGRDSAAVCVGQSAAVLASDFLSAVLAGKTERSMGNCV